MAFFQSPVPCPSARQSHAGRGYKVSTAGLLHTKFGLACCDDPLRRKMRMQWRYNGTLKGYDKDINGTSMTNSQTINMQWISFKGTLNVGTLVLI